MQLNLSGFVLITLLMNCYFYAMFWVRALWLKKITLFIIVYNNKRLKMT